MQKRRVIILAYIMICVFALYLGLMNREKSSPATNQISESITTQEQNDISVVSSEEESEDSSFALVAVVSVVCGAYIGMRRQKKRETSGKGKKDKR